RPQCFERAAGDLAMRLGCAAPPAGEIVASAVDLHEDRGRRNEGEGLTKLLGRPEWIPRAGDEHSGCAQSWKVRRASLLRTPRRMKWVREEQQAARDLGAIGR